MNFTIEFALSGWQTAACVATFLIVRFAITLIASRLTAQKTD